MGSFSVIRRKIVDCICGKMDEMKRRMVKEVKGFGKNGKSVYLKNMENVVFTLENIDALCYNITKYVNLIKKKGRKTSIRDIMIGGRVCYNF